MRMDVWIEGHEAPVGRLERREDHSLTFAYAKGAGPAQRLSLALPARSEPYSDAACRGYFANLLFEGPQLEKVLDSYRLDRGDVGALLFHLGADCPGAVSITAEGTGPGKVPGRLSRDYEPLDDDQIREIARSLHLHQRLPDLGRDPSPVAGVQGKIAVVEHNETFFIPRPGSRAPTTHILKFSPVSDPDITRHEVALLKTAEACGIKTAQCEALALKADGRRINALLSTRFDRTIQEEGDELLIARLHTEDFCQALGLPPSLKYERDSSNEENRFSTAAVGRIALGASVPAIFMRDFLGQMIFNLLVGNTDNHAKNGSVLHKAGAMTLAPLYDVVPVFIDRRVTHRFAFRHGRAEFAEDLTKDDLASLLSDLGFKKPPVGRVLAQLAELARGIAAAAPGFATKELLDGLGAQAAVIERALGVSFYLAARDFYDRIERDGEGARPGGWGGLS
jgi:serine/threonine-protein kinase HipA